MTPRTLTSIVTGLLLAGLAALSAGRAAAQDTPVPVAMQLQVMVKILNFDRKLTQRLGERLTVGVLYQGRYRTSAAVGGEVCSALMALPQSLLGALGSLQITCLPIDLDETPHLDAVLRRERIQVLYVSPLRAFPVEDVVLLARSSRITTLTGVARYVDSGCAIGVDMQGARPQILINLAASKAEGADLNAQLLKLARVVSDRTGL